MQVENGFKKLKHGLSTPKDSTIILWIWIVSAMLFIPFFSSVHLFDWDEINFAECAREMIETGDYFHVQIDYRPFWEKPPIFIWMQVLSMKLFGVNEFAARFPNAIAGIITLILLFIIGRRLVDRQFGLLWVLAYAGSFLPHFYFRSGIIDPFFNLFMMLSVVFLSYYYGNPRRSCDGRNPALSPHRLRGGIKGGGNTGASVGVDDPNLPPPLVPPPQAGGGRSGISLIFYAGIFTGLAVMTKGPVGLALPLIAWFVYWIIKRKEHRFPLVEGIIFVGSAAAVTFLWFGIEYIKNGSWFITEFTRYQIRLLTTGDAGHSQPIYYHFLVLLIGCFPASALAFGGFKKSEAQEKDPQRDMQLWMIILLGVVLILFSLVKTKIVHYSSLAYFPITYLAAIAMDRHLCGFGEWRKRNTALVIGIGVIMGIVITAIPIFGLFKEKFIPLIKDQFAVNNLQAAVQWSGGEVAFGILYLIAVIVGVIFLTRKLWLKGFATIFGSTIIIIYIILALFVPKIERYTQGAAIDFYESLQGKDCYVHVLGFKSYADLFYSKKRYEQSSAYKGIAPEDWEEWLLNGDIDKPVYFLAKSHKKWRDHPNLNVIEDRNGFVFLIRPFLRGCWEKR